MVEEEQVVGTGEKGGLTPWEQHSAVISMPRFDYRTASLLLDRSHSGFLITCPIKREKSATKEAISILGKYVDSFQSNGSEKSEPSTKDGDTKKRKLCSKETDGEHVPGIKKYEDTSTSEACEVAKGTSLSSLKTNDDVEQRPTLSLIKLTKSGLLLFTFRNDCRLCALDILSSVFYSLGSGILKPPLWCHRFFPVQATCTLKERDLYLAVSKLFQQYIDKEGDNLQRPIKFAIGYNRRGADETEAKVRKTSTEHSNGLTLLDREACFKVVAKAVKDVYPDSVVDLQAPELAVLVELLPISGLPPISLVAGISVLPHDLIATKPRLCVKALVSDAKATKRKG